MGFVLVDELVQVAAGTVFEVVAGSFWFVGSEGLVRFEGVETDDVGVAVWENVLEYGSLDGFGEKHPSITYCFAGDELMCARTTSHEVDDAFAVEADLFDEFVAAAFGTGTISGVAFFGKV